MGNNRRIYFILVTVLVFTLLATGDASADRVGRLIQILQTDASYKVRLQTVIVLGKLKSKRAVPALIGALVDEHYTVRGVASVTLAQIGDKRALPELKRRLALEKNSFVLSQLGKAIRTLERGSSAPPAGTRFFVTAGKMSNKSVGGKDLAQVLGDALNKEFASVSGVITDWGGRNPSAKELRKKKIKGFVLDGAIVSLSRKQVGSEYEISCSIKVSLATFPGNSMKAFYSGGASTMVSVRGFKAEYERGLFKDVLEGAAQGAQQHIMSSYLNTQ